MIYEIVMATGARFFTDEKPTLTPAMGTLSVVAAQLPKTAARALQRNEGRQVLHVNAQHVAYVLEHDA